MSFYACNGNKHGDNYVVYGRLNWFPPLPQEKKRKSSTASMWKSNYPQYRGREEFLQTTSHTSNKHNTNSHSEQLHERAGIQSFPKPLQ